MHIGNTIMTRIMRKCGGNTSRIGGCDQEATDDRKKSHHSVRAGATLASDFTAVRSSKQCKYSTLLKAQGGQDGRLSRTQHCPSLCGFIQRVHSETLGHNGWLSQ